MNNLNRNSVAHCMDNSDKDGGNWDMSGDKEGDNMNWGDKSRKRRSPQMEDDKDDMMSGDKEDWAMSGDKENNMDMSSIISCLLYTSPSPRD